MATIAELQTERDKLRALSAREDYDKALAATRSADDLARAAASVRAVLLNAVDAMVERFLSAIEGTQDETRVHYLMSDAAHELLTGIGSDVEAASAALPELGERFKRGAKPRDLLTVSQWADRHRWIKSGTNAPGRWNTGLTPYLREIMDCLSEHSPVRTVSFIKSSGLGGTEAMYCWIGYVMHHLQNKDLLVVVPTLELRDRSFNPRLAKMLEETEALAELTVTASRNKANRGDLLEYGARARIIKAGANSPDSLRSDHLPYVICDEVDAFPWDVGGEGDPMTLIENRQRTYSRAKGYYVSTPTVDGASRIDQLYKRSDRRRYHVACPHCAAEWPMEWPMLKYRTAPHAEGTPEGEAAQVIDAWLVCRECGGEIHEGHKTDMLTHGRWIADRPNITLARGYHLNALYAPIGLGLGWKQIAQKWLNCQGDSAELKAFVNTYLGEVWKEIGDSIEATALQTRLEAYELHNVAGLLITAGVDVQKDRLEASIVAWGDGEEAWLIDHLIIPGDTTAPDVYLELLEELKEYGVRVAAIDSGFNASAVYEFVKPRAWCFAVKGVQGMARPVVEDDKKRRQRLRVKRKKGAPVEPVGVDGAKVTIYQRLKLQKPGAGYVHFPQSAAFDDEYFQQLGAEKLVTRIKGTRPFQEWIKTRARNEALDCLVYALAALRLAGTKPQGRIIEGECVVVNAEPQPKKPESPTTTPQQTRGNNLLSRIRSRHAAR